MDFIREAGVSVYPVLLSGVLSVWWAIRYAQAREADALSRLIAWSLLTLMLGVLATATGLQASVRTIAQVPEKWAFLIGLREALNNLVLAACFVVVDLLVIANWPRRRSAPPQMASVPAPR